MSRYTTGHNRTSESKVIVVWICWELLFTISSVSIFYGIHSDIRVKSYCRFILLRGLFWISSVSIYYGIYSEILDKNFCRFNFLQASHINYERLDILRDIIGHPSKKLLSFDWAKSLCFEFRASWYITGLNQKSDLNGIHSDIRVKSYCPLNLLRASGFNYLHLDILWDTIGHPSKKISSFEFAQSLRCQFRASRYITGFIQTSE